MRQLNKLSLLSYALVVIACGRHSPTSDLNLLGGDIASPGAFPAEVALVKKGKANNKFETFCSAAKVAKNVFMTAAHCVYSTKKQDINSFFSGNEDSEELYLGYGVQPSKPGKGYYKKVEVVDYELHESYKKDPTPRESSDIALFSIREETPDITAAEVDFTPLKKSKVVLAAGYGQTIESNSEKDLPITAPRLFFVRTSLSELLPKYMSIDSLVPGTGRRSKLAPADSGGPLYAYNDAHPKGPYLSIIGVNSVRLFNQRTNVQFSSSITRFDRGSSFSATETWFHETITKFGEN